MLETHCKYPYLDVIIVDEGRTGSVLGNVSNKRQAENSMRKSARTFQLLYKCFALWNSTSLNDWKWSSIYKISNGGNLIIREPVRLFGVDFSSFTFPVRLFQVNFPNLISKINLRKSIWKSQLRKIDIGKGDLSISRPRTFLES